MHDNERFEFDSSQRGSAQFPAVLLAAAAIAAILVVNSPHLMPSASARAPAPAALAFKPMPALLNDVNPQRLAGAQAECSPMRPATTAPARWL